MGGPVDRGNGILAVPVPVGRYRFRLDLHEVPAVVYQQFLGGGLGVPGLGEHRLHRLRLILVRR